MLDLHFPLRQAVLILISKLLRMHLFNNDLFLKLAKADFIRFQRSCRAEWHGFQRYGIVTNDSNWPLQIQQLIDVFLKRGD
jgi:hypothetical protein